MNPPRDKERLLADVLACPGANGFREALLAETLGLVRRRRRSRQAWRAAGALALAIGLGVGFWRTPRRGEVHSPKRGACALIVSRPLPLSALVTTRPLSSDCVIASSKHAPVVETASSRVKPREISDAELLALTSPNPAALVRRGPHVAELVFANPDDQDELVRNGKRL